MQFNSKNAGVKRLMMEAKEMREPCDMLSAQPFEDNLFEWHFTVRGQLESKFDGGIYHGKIIFPSDYPMKPPNFIILTPNGRFELNRKICLSISGYHPEKWLPSWSVRTALMALIGFMTTEPGGALGSLSYPEKEVRKLAAASVNWKCKECGVCMKDALLPISETSKATSAETAELANKLEFKDESEKKKTSSTSTEEAGPSTPTSEAPQPPTRVEELPAPTNPVTQPPAAPEVRRRQVPVESVPPRQAVRESGGGVDVQTVMFVSLCIFCFVVVSFLLARRLMAIK